ncbi:MAG: hypothetical protein ACTSWE_04845 [Promethearchaeota archaeon]
MIITRRKIKIFNKIALIFNFLTILLGIFYVILGICYFLVLFYSFIIAISWILNIILVLIDDFRINKNNALGRRLNLLGYLFMVVQLICVFLLVGGLFLLNAAWTSKIVQYTLTYLGFFSFFVFGMVLSLFNLLQLKKPEGWTFE